VMFAVVVVAWAMYLVPMALRRHDQAARSRSIERFSSTMRVLSRRSPDDDRVVRPSLRPDAPEAVVAELERPTRAAMKAAAARRRRVVTVLLAVTIVVAVVAAFAYLPWWSAMVPAFLVIGFLWLARRQVRLANEAYWDYVANSRPEASNVVPRTAVRVDASHGAQRPPLEDDDEPTVTLTAEQVAAAAAAEQRVVAVSMQTADGDSLWDPLPVTLPTYVDKPIARRTIRTIELSDPGLFSSGHSEADSQTVANASQADAAAADASAGDAPRAANA
jgi:flagellar basal body-associated protein FliL